MNDPLHSRKQISNGCRILRTTAIKVEVAQDRDYERSYFLEALVTSGHCFLRQSNVLRLDATEEYSVGSHEIHTGLCYHRVCNHEIGLYDGRDFIIVSIIVSVNPYFFETKDTRGRYENLTTRATSNVALNFTMDNIYISLNLPVGSVKTLTAMNYMNRPVTCLVRAVSPASLHVSCRGWSPSTMDPDNICARR
ncbi:hypothetical protein ACJJTC_017507 [Scirpophaga incertulas]